MDKTEAIVAGQKMEAVAQLVAEILCNAFGDNAGFTLVVYGNEPEIFNGIATDLPPELAIKRLESFLVFMRQQVVMQALAEGEAAGEVKH